MKSLESIVGTLLGSHSPPLSVAEAEQIVLDQYGMSSSVRSLSAERDLNFHVLARDGQAYVLKIAHPAEEVSISLFQTAALQHIEKVDAALMLPRVRRTLHGKPLGSIGGDGTPSRTVRLVSYLPGRLMHIVPPTPSLLLSLGQAAGRLDVALASFHHERPKMDLPWSFEQVSRLRPLLSAVPDGALATLVEQALDEFEERVLPHQDGLPRQFVHNDLNPHNVLCDPENLEQVSGILDFGDMVHGPRIGELAVAACYHIAALSDPLVSLSACASGYTRRQPLSELEIDLLPSFIKARLAITVLITEWRASREGADRAYILKNNPSARKGLAMLAQIPPQELHHRLRQAGAREIAQ